MKMIDTLKPYGAFVENTIRPLFREIKILIDELKTAGIEVNEKNIESLLYRAFQFQVKSLLVQMFTNITVTLIVAITAYLLVK